MSRLTQALLILLILATIGGGYAWYRSQAGVNAKRSSNGNLAVHWKFDDGTGSSSAVDSSGNGRTGTLNLMDPASDWVTGQFNRALDFDGTNDVVTGADNNDYSPAANDITVSFWARVPIGTSPAGNGGCGNQGAYPISKGGGSSDWEWGVEFDNNNRVCFLLWQDQAGNHGFIEASRTINDGIWHHYAFSLDYLNRLTAFIDGVQVGTLTTFNGVMTNRTEPLRVGARGDGNYFTGQVDDVRIYKTALSDKDVITIANLDAVRLGAAGGRGPTNGLVGYWSFDGDDLAGTTVYDRSGLGNNGALAGALPIKGKAGQALLFDGTDDGVTTVDRDYFSPSVNDMTVSFWANVPVGATPRTSGACGGTGRYFIGKDEASVSADWGFENDNNDRICFDTWQLNGSNHGYVSVNRTVNDGEWHHYVGTIDYLNRMELFIDGVSVGSNTSFVGTMGNSTKEVQLGRRGDGNYMTGTLDEVRIYNRVLSSDEIISLYEFGASDRVGSASLQPQGGERLDSGLAGYWKLDDGSGGSAADASVNGNNGTLSGSPAWGTGRVNGALSFDESNDAVTVPGPTLGSTFSVAFWMNPTAGMSGAYNSLVVNDNTKGVFFMNDNDSRCGFAPRISYYYSGADHCSTKDIEYGQWNHVVVVNRAGAITYYVNGVSAGTAAAAPGMTVASFGDSGANQWYKGLLDEVRAYNRALSAEEVADLYRLTSPTGTDTSLKGYWSFNGPDISGTTALDRSGAGNNGTLVNGPTKVRGKVGQGLGFDGGDAISLNYSSVNFEKTSPFSISAWLKTTTAGFSDYQDIFIHQTDDASETGYEFLVTPSSTIYYNTFALGAWLHDSWGNSLTVSSPANSIAPNTWYHVAMTYSGSTDASGIKFYINGTAQTMSIFANQGLAGPTMQSAANAYIGSWHDGGGSFIGTIDDVRAYSRVLSATEISGLYNIGR